VRCPVSAPVEFLGLQLQGTKRSRMLLLEMYGVDARTTVVYSKDKQGAECGAVSSWGSAGVRRDAVQPEEARDAG
jgi:hypothetical protein